MCFSKQRKNDDTFCHNIGNCCNARNHGEGSLLYRMKDRMGSADQFSPLPSSLRSVGQGKTDASSSGIDTFGSHLDLCRNDKSFDCCCILDN